MIKPEEFIITTQTPIWTGGKKTGASDRIHESGLIGSLRWWFEVVVRGLGGWACDPNSGDRCPDQNESLPVEKQYCPVCRMFGATGHARAFKLWVETGNELKSRPPNNWQASIQGDACVNKYRFYEAYSGTFSIKILPQRQEKINIPEILFGLLHLIKDNAGLGSRTGLSYGILRSVIWTEPDPTISTDKWIELLKELIPSSRSSPGISGILPDLRQMFFARLPLANAWNQERFLRFKCSLREEFRRISREGDRRDLTSLRHFLLGTTSGGIAEGSKIKLALLPDSTNELKILRMWGWVPDNFDFTHDELMDKVCLFLATNLYDGDPNPKVHWCEVKQNKGFRKINETQLNLDLNVDDLLKRLLVLREGS